MKELLEYGVLCLKEKFVDIKGRARRKEYWGLFLLYVLLSIVAGIISVVSESLGSLLSLAVGGGFFVPSIAAAVRRLHDTGRSGKWLLIAFVPVIGFFVLIYFLVQDSQPGDNQWGANPKGIGNDQPQSHM